MAAQITERQFDLNCILAESHTIAYTIEEELIIIEVLMT
jgi:hypothetical protein